MRLLQESLFIVLLGYNRAAACTLLPYMGVGSYGSPPSPPRILADVASLVLGTGSCPHEMSFNIIYLIPARSRSHCKKWDFSKIPFRQIKIPPEHSRSHGTKHNIYMLKHVMVKFKETFVAAKYTRKQQKLYPVNRLDPSAF